MPLKIAENIIIEEDCISFEFARSSGPGGQNVNKVESAVLLRFDIERSSISNEVKQRLFNENINRINSKNELVLRSSESRSQLKNRQNAIQKLIEILKDAAKEPKERLATKPSRASFEKRIEKKKKLGEKKKLRRRVL